MPLELLLRPVSVYTGSGDQDGQLVLANGRLVAVLVRLADMSHAGLVGAWFLEAGFGPCAHVVAPIFSDLDAAQSWIRQQLEA